MPRISAERERAVRDRILRAAMAVFAERGFHRATMQDIVRASGLSVGAIYTHFSGKSELILASCDLVVDQELGELRGRLFEVTDYRERIAVAVGFFLDGLGSGLGNARGPSALLLEAWAAADTDPAIRDMLLRRRREVITICAMLLQEGVVRRELPAWLETAEVAHAVAGLLDGMILQSAEEGVAFRRADAERRVLSVIETMLASRGAGESPRLVAASPRPFEFVPGPAATTPRVGRMVRSARPRAQKVPRAP